MKILVTMPTEAEHIETLTSACPNDEFIFLNDIQPSEEQLASAEVIIGNIPVDCLDKCTSLKLLQLNMAGSDAFAGKLQGRAYISNASGAYGLAISEHMLGMLLMLMKKLDLYHDNQKNSLWNDEGNVNSIENSRVLTIGLGDIGGEFARKCKLLGAYCIGIRRNLREKPYYMDEIHSLSALDSLLPTVDVVALALPNNSESKHLMNEYRLGIMKKDSILLNVGRGNAIDTDALVSVLNNGHIMAGLDVTDPEPLPADHPLWKCKRALITPHISGWFHLRKTHDRIIEIAAENIKNLIDGKPIKNLVDPETGYRCLNNRY